MTLHRRRMLSKIRRHIRDHQNTSPTSMSTTTTSVNPNLAPIRIGQPKSPPIRIDSTFLTQNLSATTVESPAMGQLGLKFRRIISNEMV